MSDDAAPICPCEAVAFPVVIENPPGLPSIRYRVGDYGSFRDALLRGQPGEVELLGFRPTGGGDLALQLLEWWAYLADILTFYNERIANNVYLGTADLPGNVERIVRVLGYRPLPGIGATGHLAALVNAKVPLTIPQGFAVQSKPGPGQQPQVFEADASKSLYLPTASGGAAPVDPVVGTTVSGRRDLLLRGTVTTVKPGDEVVVAGTPLKAINSEAMTVLSVTPEKDPRGRVNSRITFGSSLTVPGGDVTAYRVLRSDQFQIPYPYAPALTALPFLTMHLASIARSISVGDLVVFEVPVPSGTAYTPAVVTSYAEVVWYANADDPAGHPEVQPGGGKIPIPVLHTVLKFDVDTPLAMVRMGYGFRPIADVIDNPAGPTVAGTSLTLTPLAPVSPTARAGDLAFLEGADDLGEEATLTASPSAQSLQVTTPADATLTLPLRVLFNLFPVSAGKTVSNEVLGSGDATVAGQTFVLQKSPLTYLEGSDPSFPTSTLVVRVDGLAWREVKSFYAQPADAQVFVTREDQNQLTQVIFGDGVNGARLTTGAGNVIATYRYGSGPGDPRLGGPAPGSLVTILNPRPGLQAVRNPVAMTGGAAPTPSSQVRQYAPRSVLTFGRAISASDFEAIAAQAPGVTRARAYFTWSPARQRTTVTVYVGGAAGALAAAQQAVNNASDPNNPVTVSPGTEVPLSLAFALAFDPRFDGPTVEKAVVAALGDPDTGLFSPSRSRLGAALYDSQIYAACLGVPGVVAVRGLTITDKAKNSPLPGVQRHAQVEGGFFSLSPDDVHVSDLEEDSDG